MHVEYMNYKQQQQQQQTNKQIYKQTTTAVISMPELLPIPIVMSYCSMVHLLRIKTWLFHL